MPFTAVVYNIYFNQFYVFFPFFILFNLTGWPIWYIITLPSESSGTQRAQQIRFIYIFNENQWRTRYRCMRIVLSLLALFNYTNKYIHIFDPARMPNTEQMTAKSKFYSKYQFHFYFTLEIWQNRFIWAVHSVHKVEMLEVVTGFALFSHSLFIRIKHNNWMRLCFSIILRKFCDHRILLISIEWKRLRWNQLFVCRFIASRRCQQKKWIFFCFQLRFWLEFSDTATMSTIAKKKSL